MNASTILAPVHQALNLLAEDETTSRALLKQIRTKEEDLIEWRKDRFAAGSKARSIAAKLQKLTPENSKSELQQAEQLQGLVEHIQRLDENIGVGQARLGDLKRETTRNLLALKLEGLFVFGEISRVRYSILSIFNANQYIIAALSPDRCKLGPTINPVHSSGCNRARKTPCCLR
jgi:hypothetical protein